MAKVLINECKNKLYIQSINDWNKWRLAYIGGTAFKDTYLYKLSKREDEENYTLRKNISYAPSFSKAAINDLRNAIYQRMTEIKRIGGSDNYQTAIKGSEQGVDQYGRSMNTFIGQEILSELLPMGRVGIFVDKIPTDSEYVSKANVPYLYFYCVEDIFNWSAELDNKGQMYFYNLLLKITNEIYDDITGLCIGEEVFYRHFWKTDEGIIQVDDWEIYKDDTDEEKQKIKRTNYLSIDRIPFVMPTLSCSLMEDIADIQIALLNTNSSDLAYIIKGNTPFYVEQYDARTDNIYSRVGSGIGPIITEGMRQADSPNAGTALAAKQATTQEVEVGGTTGRRYPVGANQPDFIHPSPEPLLASMKKQEQMKEDIRQLINLGVANVKSQHASADSKGMDDRSMEAGLSAIGQELQWAENEIAKIWALYDKTKPAEVKYPEKYDLKSDKDKEDSCKSLDELKDAVPSNTFRKAVCKKMSRTLLFGTVSDDTLNKIDKEVDEANFLTSNSDEIQKDLESGIVSKVTASIARGYEGVKEVPVAEKEHATRLAEIAASQSAAARGLDKNTPDAKIEKKESQDPAINPTGGGPLTRS